MAYELYREKFKITEWRDGAIFRTASEGLEWFDEDVVKGNVPKETDVLYAPPSTSFEGMTIRHKK